MDTLTGVRFILKPVVFLVALLPALLVVGDAYGITGSLSANPIEDIQARYNDGRYDSGERALLVEGLLRRVIAEIEAPLPEVEQTAPTA